MSDETLERKAEQIYEFLFAVYKKWGGHPPVSRTKLDVDLSRKEEIQCLEALKQEGYIAFAPRDWYGIHFTDETRTTVTMAPGTASLPARPAYISAPKLEPPSDPARKDRMFERAVRILHKQGKGAEYAQALAWIKGELHHPGWWDSSLEIVVAAEFVRRGYKVKPQHAIDGHHYDLYIYRLRLVIEVDGSLYHSMKVGFERDQKALGWALRKHRRAARLTEQEILEDVRGTVDRALQSVRRGFVYSKQLASIADPEDQKRYIRDMLAASAKPVFRLLTNDELLERIFGSTEKDRERRQEREEKREQLSQLREAINEEGHTDATHSSRNPEVS